LRNAQELFKNMQSLGHSPKMHTFGVMFIEEALSLFSFLRDSDLKYGVEVFNIIIGGLCRAGKLEEARE